MLTSFFGKSKPINYFLVCAVIMLGYFAWLFWSRSEPSQWKYFPIGTLMIFLTIFLVLLLDFIIRKNNLTAINNYAIFFFGCMLLLIPNHISEADILWANIFLLLGFRRILSLQSEKNRNKKIFDAAFWIAIATLFYFWSILFFIILIISIGMRRSSRNYRHFLIPFAGLLTVIILGSTYNAFFESDVFWFLHIKPGYSLDLNKYDNNASQVIAVFLVIATLWAMFKGIFRYPRLAKKKKPNHILLLMILAIGLAIALISKDSNGTEFLFLFFPLSILMTSAIETTRLKWLKETILWMFIIIPVVILMLN